MLGLLGQIPSRHGWLGVPHGTENHHLNHSWNSTRNGCHLMEQYSCITIPNANYRWSNPHVWQKLPFLVVKVKSTFSYGSITIFVGQITLFVGQITLIVIWMTTLLFKWPLLLVKSHVLLIKWPLVLVKSHVLLIKSLVLLLNHDFAVATWGVSSSESHGGKPQELAGCLWDFLPER